MRVLQYAHDKQGKFREELKQGGYGFFELTADGVSSFTVMDAEKAVADGNRSVLAYSTQQMPFEYALYGVDFKHCSWPVTLQLGMLGRIVPDDELGRILRLDGEKQLAREAIEWFYEIMDGKSQELKAWFNEHVCAMEEPTMIEKYGIDALPLKGVKTPFDGFLPSWFECQLVRVEFSAKPINKNCPPEQAEQERLLDRLLMKYGLSVEMLKGHASRHSLTDAEKWMELAHQLSDAKVIAFGDAFQQLSSQRTLEDARRMVEDEKKQAICRQVAQSLQATNTIAAKNSLEVLVREISFRGEKAVAEKYAREEDYWKAAEDLASKMPQKNSRPVELLYQEISTSGIEKVYAKYLPVKDKKDNFYRWGAIVSAIILVIVIILLWVIR